MQALMKNIGSILMYVTVATRHTVLSIKQSLHKQTIQLVTPRPLISPSQLTKVKRGYSNIK